MNEAVRSRSVLFVLLGAAVLLLSAAWLRSAEYDEQYTLFLTGRVARPLWPPNAITAVEVRGMQVAEQGPAAIARDLRATDVHPPLYFWMISAWRRLLGNSVFVARLASVLCSIATLYFVRLIARAAAIPAVLAMLLTIGCYGFVYTGTIARGFALAQMLSVAGVALLADGRGRPHRMLTAGALLGAATFTNYLAAFVGCAGVLHTLRRTPVAFAAVCTGFVAWLPADLWFFLAQRHSRSGQFEAFEPLAVIARLARYSVANMFGGLPLYSAGVTRLFLAAGVSILFLLGMGAIAGRWRSLATPEARRLLGMCAIAPPLGLFALGFVFGNAPVELRYLAFATPYAALLLAAALPRWLRYATLTVQALALVGLMTRAETMQPARATAQAAASLVRHGVVLLPRGNDGVGIVGAFANEAPPAMRILIIDADTPPEQIRDSAVPFSPVVLVLLAQDASSRATLPSMRAAVGGPCWRLTGEGFNVLAYEHICAGR
ncbi:MAG TPA: glycosyltransferase family 39 protein [Acetobacteraceae bacterium]